MKVILVVDDKKLGKKNSIIDVADGYANNVLIPRKIAVQATKQNMTKANLLKIKEEHDLAQKRLIAHELADRLKNEVKVGDEVVILEPRYHDYTNGTILKFTPKGFRVQYYRHDRSDPVDTVVGTVIKGKIYEDT